MKKGRWQKIILTFNGLIVWVVGNHFNNTQSEAMKGLNDGVSPRIIMLFINLIIYTAFLFMVWRYDFNKKGARTPKKFLVLSTLGYLGFLFVILTILSFLVYLIF